MNETTTYEKPLTTRRVDELFQEAMNEGDLDKAMSLYDDNAVFVQEPGKPAISGLENIRKALEQFQAIKPELKVEVMQFVEADDVAFYTLKWEIKGTSPEGEEIFISSYDGNVVKRQPAGSFKRSTKSTRLNAPNVTTPCASSPLSMTPLLFETF